MVLSISPKVLGQRVKQLRTQQGMTQEDLAAGEYSKSYISAIEQGKTRPSLVALQRIASRLGVPAGTLLDPGATSFGRVDPELMPRRVRKPRGSKAGRVGATALAHAKHDFQLDLAELLVYAGRAVEALGMLRPLVGGNRSETGNQVLTLDMSRSQRAYYLAALAEVQAGNAASGIAYAQRGMQIATRQSDQEGLEHLRLALGKAYSGAGQYLSALEQYQACLKAVNSGAVHDPEFKLNVLSSVVQDYVALEDYEQASAAYAESQQLIKDLSQLDEHGRLLWDAALNYSTAHQDAIAAQMTARAITAYRMHDSMRTIAKMLRLSASVFAERDKLDEAETQLERSLALAESFQLPVDKAMSLTSIARLSLRRGDTETATRQAQNAVAICRLVLKDAENVGSSSVSLGRKGEISVEVANRTGANKSLVRALAALGEIATAQRETEQADQAFSEALRLLEDGVKVENSGDIYRAYAQVLMARGEHERALQYLERAYETASQRLR